LQGEADLTMKRLRRRHSPRSIGYTAHGKEANSSKREDAENLASRSVAAHDSYTRRHNDSSLADSLRSLSCDLRGKIFMRPGITKNQIDLF
ncbi:MAG: hypothetical protein IJU76_06870, partial [Desulfovibrionaceae bacterium]|nr:hypothetical protein [Desulfovibrionaceae bacterium]